MFNRLVQSNYISKYLDKKFLYSVHQAVAHHVSRVYTPLANDNSVMVDVGCSKGTFMKILRETDISTFGYSYSIGLDIFRPNLFCAKKVYTDVIQCDVKNLPLRESSCDIILAVEIVEHLTKHAALTLIKDLDRISKKTIVLTTPVGFNIKEDLEDNNPWQLHISSWNPEELRKLGFMIYGIGGARFFRGEKSELRFTKKMFKTAFRFLSFASHFITRKYVTKSFQMLCIKNCKKEYINLIA